MANKPFVLAKSEEEVRQQLQGFFERAVKANEKFRLYCEKVGVDPQNFYNKNLPILTSSTEFELWRNQVRTTFKLPTQGVVKDKVVLDFSDTQLKIPED